MAYSDYFVLKALIELGEQRVTYEQIAKACELSCCERTVNRAITRLQNSGRIKRLNRSKAGCIYTVVEVASANAR